MTLGDYVRRKGEIEIDRRGAILTQKKIWGFRMTTPRRSCGDLNHTHIAKQ